MKTLRNVNVTFMVMAAATTLAAFAGCSPNTGFIVRPIPVEETLVETVIAADPGMFIGDKIAVVDVDGLIVNQRLGLLGINENPVTAFVEKIEKAQADKDVKAVVLRLNSPGGGVTASDIMYDKLMNLRSSRKIPVVAIIEDVGASGAYYLACGADTILAHPTSVTGSIGVLIQTVSFSGTMRLIGIDAKAIVSGPRKDMASPFKPFDEKDQAVLQEMVNGFYQRFVDVVAKGRPKLTREQVLALADGRVYTGEQAKGNGLVDGLGYMDDAISLAKKLSGRSQVKVVIYGRPWGYRPNAYASTASPSPQAESPQVNLVNISVPELLRLGQPQFLYLWTGGIGH